MASLRRHHRRCHPRGTTPRDRSIAGDVNTTNMPLALLTIPASCFRSTDLPIPSGIILPLHHCFLLFANGVFLSSPLLLSLLSPSFLIFRAFFRIVPRFSLERADVHPSRVQHAHLRLGKDSARKYARARRLFFGTLMPGIASERSAGLCAAWREEKKGLSAKNRNVVTNLQCKLVVSRQLCPRWRTEGR